MTTLEGVGGTNNGKTNNAPSTLNFSFSGTSATVPERITFMYLLLVPIATRVSLKLPAESDAEENVVRVDCQIA